MAGEGLPGLEKGYWGRRRATGAGEGISGPEKGYWGRRRDIGAGEEISGLEKGYRGRRRGIGAGEGISGPEKGYRGWRRAIGAYGPFGLASVPQPSPAPVFILDFPAFFGRNASGQACVGFLLFPGAPESSRLTPRPLEPACSIDSRELDPTL